MPWSPARADPIMPPAGTASEHLDALERHGLELGPAMNAACGLVAAVERDSASHDTVIDRAKVLLQALVLWKDRTELPQLLLDALSAACSSLHRAYLLEKVGAADAVREVKKSNPILQQQCRRVMSQLLLTAAQQEQLRQERHAEAEVTALFVCVCVAHLSPINVAASETDRGSVRGGRR